MSWNPNSAGFQEGVREGNAKAKKDRGEALSPQETTDAAAWEKARQSSQGGLGNMLLGSVPFLSDLSGQNAAKQQVASYGQAADRTRQFGQKAAGMYDQRGQAAQGYYNNAQSLAGSYAPPTYSQSAYNTLAGRYGQPAAASSPSRYSTGSSTFTPMRNLSGTTGYGSTGAAPAMAAGLAAQAPQPYTSNTQSYVNNYQPLTGAQGYAGQRAATGYDNALTGRYAQRSSTPYSSNLGNELDSLRGFATGGTSAGGLGDELAGRYGQRDQLDTRLSERYNFAGNDTNTSGALGRLDRLNPTWNSDAMARTVGGADYAANSGSLTGQLQSGATQGGQMINDLRGGNTAGARFTDYLQGPGSDSARFMGGFNPETTRGLDSTYQKLAAEGPTYEEDFYTSQLTGENPAYRQLQDDLTRKLRYNAAAKGGFSSGVAADSEERGLSRLAAEEFSRRADLASRAGAARRDRLGQELTGATALDSQLLGQRGLYAQTALGREGMMGDQAGKSDALRAGLAGDQDQLLGDLSKFRDSQGLEKDRLGADLAKFGDTQNLNREELYLKGAGQQDSFLRQDQDAIDSLTGQRISADLDQDRIRSGLATADDSARTARMGDYAGSLSAADQNRMTYDRDLDSLAGSTSASTFARDQQLDSLYGRGFDEQRSNADRLLDASKAADSDQRQQDSNLLTGARDASNEARDAYRDRFDAAMRVGDARSAMQSAYDMAAVGAITASEVSAIATQLAAAGVEAAQVNAFVNTVLQGIGLVSKDKDDKD